MPLSVGSGAGLGWRAGWAQHRGKGAPLFDGGDHVDRREGEDAGGGGSGREGHGGGSRQRGARGHNSGAGQGGGAGAAGKAVGDTTGKQHQSEQRGWGPAWAIGPVWAADHAPGSNLPRGAVRVLGRPVQGRSGGGLGVSGVLGQPSPSWGLWRQFLRTGNDRVRQGENKSNQTVGGAPKMRDEQDMTRWGFLLRVTGILRCKEMFISPGLPRLESKFRNHSRAGASSQG